MSKLGRYIALLVLALWGLASVHCKLEAMPGLDLLKTCCFAESTSNSDNACDTDSCSTIEDGKYLLQKQNTSAPQPALVLALQSYFLEAPLLSSVAGQFASSKDPPTPPNPWQFSHRTALPPRAPSSIS